MLEDFDQYFINKKEPIRSCLLALQKIITSVDEQIKPAWKYRMPFYCYGKKMFCYLWTDKKTGLPYIGIVEGGRIDHPLLELGDRKRMKILRVNPNEDIPVEEIKLILRKALEFYK